MVRSPDAESTRPSASSTGSTDQTVASCPSSVRKHSPSFHTFTVLSHDAE